MSRPASPWVTSVFNLRSCLLWISILLASTPAFGAIEIGDKKELSLFGDFRVRLEQDWDSHREDGSAREDRLRARVRARLGLDWKPVAPLHFGLRLRSGVEGSQQSAHITVLDFDGNDTGEAGFYFDRWFLEARGEKVWGWVGRNSFPFWTQNEMFWDDDVTPVGLAGGWSSGNLSVRSAYLGLPVGMKDFTGNLAAGQVVYDRNSPGLSFTLAAGLYSFDGDPEDVDASRLRNDNGQRDYSIAMGSVQTRFEAAGRRLTLGMDLLHNGESYGPDDPFAFAHRDATDGFVLSAMWGTAAKAGDWGLGYWYGRIEALAVNASVAQDDWVRWGSSTQTDSSDLRGHELRFIYGLGNRGNLTARLYLIEAISSDQDGNRFRVDYNVKF
ncbi:MAG: putative porin [Thermoanaerobaculia bacterium]|nr:putative porin [Thermoanaerobaculia bacterium]